jgi:glycosyltransferase involved in cell wall biosynthesis
MTANFSVLLPVFNGERFLSKAIESVLEQTYADFELLVFDAGSQDRSFEIAARYAGSDKRIIHWRSVVSPGLFESYNQCLTRCQGRFVKLLGQNDLLTPGMLAASVDVLESNPGVSLVATGRGFIDRNGNQKSWPFEEISADRFVKPAVPVAGMEVAVKSLVPIRNIVGYFGTVSLRRTACGDGFDPDFERLGDLDLWLRVLQSGQFYFLPERLCNTIVHRRRRAEKDSYLSFAGDLLKLGAKLQPFLRLAGVSDALYKEGALESIVKDWRHRADAGELSLADISKPACLIVERGQPEHCLTKIPTFEDVHMLEQLAIQTLTDWRRSQSLYTAEKQLWLSVFRYEQLIEQREHQLAKLLSGRTWQLTKSMRELKSRLRLRLGSGLPVASTDSTDRSLPRPTACSSSVKEPVAGAPMAESVSAARMTLKKIEPASTATILSILESEAVLKRHKEYLRELRQKIIAVRGSLSLRLITFVTRRAE